MTNGQVRVAPSLAAGSTGEDAKEGRRGAREGSTRPAKGKSDSLRLTSRYQSRPGRPHRPPAVACRGAGSLQGNRRAYPPVRVGPKTKAYRSPGPLLHMRKRTHMRQAHRFYMHSLSAYAFLRILALFPSTPDSHVALLTFSQPCFCRKAIDILFSTVGAMQLPRCIRPLGLLRLRKPTEVRVGLDSDLVGLDLDLCFGTCWPS